MKKFTCCFTGHRKLPNTKLDMIINRLNQEIDKLIAQGVTNFISGGALGFDTFAASRIISKKEDGCPIRLILALPCKNQDKNWSPAQKQCYQSMLTGADEIIHVSEEYSADCMKKRNYYMVDNSAYCICALLHERSGTGQTLRYAKANGLSVVNVAE